ncbi:uncharacterized protein LOC105840206 [Monomorium pharaonis]|uniref:uncharacterized protein LOC105840206 n=1 Tax=Monomorium pharaonis TaxID=307658 RepID=UPI00063F1770|nr:uncharacterized protein LOC105840206 [Monomorium pharaonis]
MTDFKQQYKNSRPWFGDTDQRRFLRAYNYDKSRKEVRLRAFNKNRNLQYASPISQPGVSTITNNRMKKLIRWKEERDRKKKLEASKKKPAFKVGIVHHSFYSPVNGSKVALKTPKKTEHSKTNAIQKRITRATEKRLLAKAAAAVKQPIKNLPLVSTKQPVKTSFAPVDYCFKPPPGLQATPLFGLISIKQTPQEKYITPPKNIQISDNIIQNFKTFTSLRLSVNKQNSSKKLNKPSICNSNKLNITTRSSLKEQVKNQIDMQEQNSSSSSTDIKTLPLQKITPTCSEKENCAKEDLIIFSPYLTRSRGKRNSRKGQQRLGIGRRSEEISTKNIVMQNLNICVEEEGRTAQYFKFLVKKETDRLKELCKKWLDIRFEKDVPEDAIYEIQQAVGQTNLLINKKFERFHSLVQDCETGKGKMLVTCRDLQGFWDLTYQEIEDCNMRFEKLKNRRNRKWQEEEEEYTAKPAVKKRIPVNKQKSKKQIVSSKSNKLQSFILAARKKHKIETDTLNKEVLLLQDVDINKKLSKRKSSIVENKKDADTWHSARRSGSIKKMEFSDKSKKMRSPFATKKKIIQKCKTPEVQLDDTISYVNFDQTQSKSILKKSKELENKEARIKFTHKVNFDNTVLTEVPLDEELQNKLSLAAALNRIDSLDLDVMNQSPHFIVGKELDFKTKNSDSSDDLSKLGLEKIEKRNKSLQNTSDVHTFIDVTSSVSIKKSHNGEISGMKNLRNRHKNTPNEKKDILFSPLSRDGEMIFTDEIILNDTDDLYLGTKVLRNRTVLANNTPKSNTTNKMTTLKRASKERKNSLKSSRKSSLKLQKDGNNYITPNKSYTMEKENVTLMDNIIKKRSLRKSVAFDATCVACAENKPVLPMTPYSTRRSKTPSRQSRNKHALQDEDLISWNTPDKNRPPRVTRSRSENF